MSSKEGQVGRNSHDHEVMEPKSPSDPSIDTQIDATDKDGDTYITGIRLFAVLLGITFVVFLVMLDSTIVVTAIPKISDEFNSIKDIGWYGSAYMLTLASLQPLSGKIYQQYSSKISFLTGLALFELGSLICALANSSNMLIVGRAIAGVGGSGLLTGMLTILSSSAPLEKRPLYLGIIFGLGSVGMVTGPILGGVFAEHASWRWCFYINLPFGGITAAIITFIKIPDAMVKTDTKPTWREAIVRLDLVGCVAFLPACLMLLLALQWGGVTYAWSSATVIGLLVGSAVSLVLFLFWEKTRGEAAMIPLSMLRNRIVACAAGTSFFSAATLMIGVYYLPIWFQVVKGVNPTIGGVHFIPTIGGVVLGSVLTGGLSTRLGVYTPFAIIGCAFGAISSGLLSTLKPSASISEWIGYQILFGLARGMVLQQPLTAVQVILAKEMQPVGNAIVVFSQSIAAATFIAFAQTIFSNRLKSALPHFAPGVVVELVLSVGATDFKDVVPSDSVTGVVSAYNEALTVVYYLGIAAACLGFATSWGLGWTNIKKKKQDTEAGQKTGEKAAIQQD